ncbi:hypothetical protein KP509_02G085900 [Ceratopteris richardii]|uniref:Uncharacterized protein n=1 Tax=Ceratopteris richardii TaxID=49495 RepID=A0A8T2V800_CERRI|nr:hypothetical protein KP509_02G085900 [Ceratopteris richardii]KAH7444632.1 hypothetical protein KP509_02G085900 [Ceratopteris richardii]
MNKFNQSRRSLLKEKRAKRDAQRRLKSGNASLKVQANRPSHTMSGKQRRKLLRTWRRTHGAIEGALASLQDSEMIAVDEGVQSQSEQVQKVHKVHVKKKARLMLKKAKKQAAKQGNLNEDAMMQ